MCSERPHSSTSESRGSTRCPWTVPGGRIGTISVDAGVERAAVWELVRALALALVSESDSLLDLVSGLLGAPSFAEVLVAGFADTFETLVERFVGEAATGPSYRAMGGPSQGEGSAGAP